MERCTIDANNKVATLQSDLRFMKSSHGRLERDVARLKSENQEIKRENRRERQKLEETQAEVAKWTRKFEESNSTSVLFSADRKGPEKLDWGDDAPNWRRASPGLCIEGRCANRRCKAYDHTVIMDQGYTKFDLINDLCMCKCPMCDEGVEPVTCGFNNCEWKMIWREVEPGKHPQMFKTDWKSVGNLYERFSLEKSSFLDLKILCQKSCEQETSQLH